MYLEEGGWECSSAQWVAGTQGASLPLPVDPTSPMCALPLTTTTLRDHPLRKGGGVTPSANQNPQAPGVQPMGWPWPCRGRTQGGRGGAASVGGAHVSGPGRRRGGGRLGPEAWALQPSSPRVPLPSVSFASARSGRTCSRREKKKTGPQRLTSTSSKKTVTDNSSTRLRKDREESFRPAPDGVLQGWEEEEDGGWAGG